MGGSGFVHQSWGLHGEGSSTFSNFVILFARGKGFRIGAGAARYQGQSCSYLLVGALLRMKAFACLLPGETADNQRLTVN